jgi:hypothetical protein
MKNESSVQRIKRLVAETRCECGQQAVVSTHIGHGQYQHTCRDCRGWALSILDRMFEGR